MPVLTCPRCQRANPAEAVFCHFDGAELRPLHGNGEAQARGRLPHEFVFPSGRRCRTYDELAQGCQDEWPMARRLLKQGVFAKFLAGAGRMDLAQKAHAAQDDTDPDRGLDTFLAALPATVARTPRLDLNPRRLMLGTLRVGETRRVALTVLNQGKGLLQGTLTIGEGSTWLLLADGTGKSECRLQAAREQAVNLLVDTRGLPAPQSYSAKLTVISNGGIVEVPVRVDVAAHPFPRAPFQGVSSPREMAEIMRSQPKAAVPLLESGEIGRWFAQNGWTYPVQGVTARGVAAVQQFFEGMGLSKPPTVQVAESDLLVRCQHPEKVSQQVVLRTAAKKWVYAHVESDVPWLRVQTPNVSGPQQASVTFEVDSSLVPATTNPEGRLLIIANAGQQLSVRVRVSVQRPQKLPPPRGGIRHALLIGAVAGLLFRLLLAGPVDLYARVWLSGPVGGVPAGSFASWIQAPLADAGFVRHVAMATWWLGAVAGFALLWRDGSRRSDAPFGLVAGAVAGLVGSATLACLIPAVDLLPRSLWATAAELTGNNRAAGPVWLWTPVWIATATASWTAIGAAAGFALACAGPVGTALLGRVERALAWAFSLCGMKRAALFFARS
jgi:hypothetical protein